MRGGLWGVDTRCGRIAYGNPDLYIRADCQTQTPHGNFWTWTVCLFFIGTLFNAILFFLPLVLFFFVLCKVLFQPLHDLAYFPTMMKTIDAVKAIENRNEYAYILSHEVGLFIGRAFGMSLFISLAFWVSEEFALKYALVIVGAIQLLSLPLAKISSVI